jgi:hypothetical protein
MIAVAGSPRSSSGCSGCSVRTPDTAHLTSARRLHAGSPAGPSIGRVVHEPRLTERIVDRCLGIDARVLPVEGAAGDILSEAGGIAALLRW